MLEVTLEVIMIISLWRWIWARVLSLHCTTVTVANTHAHIQSCGYERKNTRIDVLQVDLANFAAARFASLCRYEPSFLCEDINAGVYIKKAIGLITSIKQSRSFRVYIRADAEIILIEHYSARADLQHAGLL